MFRFVLGAVNWVASKLILHTSTGTETPNMELGQNAPLASPVRDQVVQANQFVVWNYGGEEEFGIYIRKVHAAKTAQNDDNETLFLESCYRMRQLCSM